MIRELNTDKALSRTNIPVAKYTINPYTGCSIGCKYCFARFIGPFKDFGGEWGKDEYVKSNIVGDLERELRTVKPARVFLSSNC